ncbi:hypothetical protein M422DRAFT_270780 [Sphaerobolus stellatus SS14]|uniref:cystathionine gamma-lyase n=1 Tax=Sphaerobolus stellatus (strain SS14) TaxID=990650 RepID=A0A0C9URN3_SPHS4|nr:hypothetical protein M422DRAFT_270780 [Sphaerobolus stellatus SS14]
MDCNERSRHKWLACTPLPATPTHANISDDFSTRAIHIGSEHSRETGTVIPPISKQSTPPSSPFSTSRLSPPPSSSISLHSITKYINGHSDVLMGAVILPNASTAEVNGNKDTIDALYTRLQFLQNAHFVNVWVFVDKAKEGNERRGKGDFPFGGMVSFRFGGAGELADDGAAERFLTRTRLFTLAESLGGVGSLAELPEKMTNGSIPPAERVALGITPNFIRLTVGVEDVGDWNKPYLNPFEDRIERIDNVSPWIGDFIGNINVQLTSVITSVIVSHLFLDLREAAYRSRKSYDHPSAITATVGEWSNFNQSESGQSHPNIQPGCHTRENQFIGQRTLRDLMEYEDFAVDLQHFDDGDYNFMSEKQELFLKENFEVGV